MQRHRIEVPCYTGLGIRCFSLIKFDALDGLMIMALEGLYCSSFLVVAALSGLPTVLSFSKRRCG